MVEQEFFSFELGARGADCGSATGVREARSPLPLDTHGRIGGTPPGAEIQSWGILRGRIQARTKDCGKPGSGRPLPSSCTEPPFPFPWISA